MEAHVVVVGQTAFREQQVDAVQARELTNRIRLGLEGLWELVKDAYRSQAWSVLGYGSWDEYCTREFGSLPMQPPREERQQVIDSLRSAGLSIRAIGAVTGLGVGTVHAAIASSSVPEVAGAEVLGVDGKNYPAAAVAHNTAVVQDVEMGDVLPAQMGIGLLDVSAPAVPVGKDRLAAVRKLTASSKAPLPLVISLAHEVMNGPQLIPGTDEEAEDVLQLGIASSRGILALGHLLRALSPEPENDSVLELANNVQDAITILGEVLDEIHAR